MSKTKKIFLILLLIVFFIVFLIKWRNISMMIPQVKIFEMAEVDRLPLGRASIGIFDNYKVRTVSGNYDGLLLRSKKNVSETSFYNWTNNRWEEIKKDDSQWYREYPAEIKKILPNSVIFKFAYIDAGTLEKPDPSFKYEGAMWLDNKVLSIAPGGYFCENNIVYNIVNHVKEIKYIDNKMFCLDFYCLNLPVSKNETAEMIIDFPKTPGFSMRFFKENYTAEQNKYFSQRTPSGSLEIPLSDLEGHISGLPTKIVKVDGIEGEMDVYGETEHIFGGGYRTSIETRWYHPGTSNDPSDPEISIDSVYTYETDHKPTKEGWFDDETVKKTGFSAEKFMSIWDATLKSFKRNR